MKSLITSHELQHVRIEVQFKSLCALELLDLPFELVIFFCERARVSAAHWHAAFELSARRNSISN